MSGVPSRRADRGGIGTHPRTPVTKHTPSQVCALCNFRRGLLPALPPFLLHCPPAQLPHRHGLQRGAGRTSSLHDRSGGTNPCSGNSISRVSRGWIFDIESQAAQMFIIDYNVRIIIFVIIVNLLSHLHQPSAPHQPRGLLEGHYHHHRHPRPRCRPQG